MAINPSVAKHLTEARRELIAQREVLNRDIAQLDAMLQGYAPDTVLKVRNNVASSLYEELIGPPPALKDAVIDYLRSTGRETASGEIVDHLADTYGWALASIRSELSRMAGRGEIGRPRRGVYHWDPSTTTEDPASTGSSGDVAATGSGGDSHSQIDQDHGSSSSSADRDHRSGASIGRFTT